ncbi:hypothetical protein ACE6H2_020719 [Prunus campanulata]
MKSVLDLSHCSNVPCIYSSLQDEQQRLQEIGSTNKKDASGLYGKSFPHYYALGEIYGKDRAIGTHGGNANDDEEDVRRDDASVHQNRSDVEDLEDDETTFTQPNPQPLSAQQKRLAQDVASGPNHPRRKVNALNEMSNKFRLMAEVVAGMAPQLACLVNVLSTEKDLADMQAKLGGELRKIEFLSPLQVFRITNVLAKEHDLLRVIFTMTDTPFELLRSWVWQIRNPRDSILPVLHQWRVEGGDVKQLELQGFIKRLLGAERNPGGIVSD